MRPVCGDSRVGMGEACDTGGATSTCDADCTDVRCGDGEPNAAAGEECDDGNTMSGDGCAQTCIDEPDTCGDGKCDLAGGVETCDNCMSDCMALPECNGCMDADGDGYYDDECGGNDCDDASVDVHPDGTEINCNDRDDDCDRATLDLYSNTRLPP